MRKKTACLFRLAGLLLILGVLGSVRAQDPSNVSLDELENKEFRLHHELLKHLLKGTAEAEPNNKAHQDAIDFYARYSTYRLANPLFHKVINPDPRKTIARLYQDYDSDIAQLVAGKEKTREMSRLFGLKLIEHCRKVLDVPTPLVQVNAARFLARSADLGQPELADALADILKDPKYGDAVKYYALHGLRRLLELPLKPPLLTEARAAKVLPPVTAVVERKMAVTQMTPPEEIDGFRYLRREAIRVLALSRLPSLSSKDQPALMLARVVARDGLTPAPRMDERAEAAIGLARMRPGKDKDYQPDYAVQQIALFLDEFATWYQTQNREEHRPVRVLAAQLLEALEQLKNDTKDPYVTRMLDGGVKRLLETIEKNNNADPSEVVALAEANPPASGQLFKSVTNSKVKPANRKAE